MKIYKKLEEVLKDVKDNVLVVNESVTFEFSLKIEASLQIAGDINAGNINAWDINARNINAWDINARDINAWNINAGNINAWDISFFAVVFAYVKFICKSIKGCRENSKYFSLDGKVEFKTDNVEFKTDNDDKKNDLLAKADELIGKANELKEQANKF